MTDEALRGKLSALYTFEEDFTIHDYRCAAVDPFTGEAVGENGTYGAGAACAAISRGHSARAFRTGSAPLTLPAPAEGGVSLSFWAYNEEVLAGAQQTGASVGYSSLLRAEGIAVGWGSLTVGGLPLSPADAQLGSAAYTPARLQAASAALGEDLLWQPPAAAGNGYYSPNAVSGGYEGPEGTEAERAMAASQAGALAVHHRHPLRSGGRPLLCRRAARLCLRCAAARSVRELRRHELERAVRGRDGRARPVRRTDGRARRRPHRRGSAHRRRSLALV